MQDNLKSVIKEDMGLSIAEYSRFVGVDYKTVYRWISKESKMPETAIKLTEYYLKYGAL